MIEKQEIIMRHIVNPISLLLHHLLVPEQQQPLGVTMSVTFIPNVKPPPFLPPFPVVASAQFKREEMS
jgi:hypothetical protein